MTAADREDNYHRIWRTVADIPVGKVATYGQIAELAGLPRQARLVGYALHNTPDDLVIPWHRVINASGRISFPKDSEPYQRQFALLSEEGVAFIAGRVDLAQYRWHGENSNLNSSLDELLWRPEE